MVRVTLESIGVYYSGRKSATDRESIAHNVPLPIGAVEEEQFSKVVDQACELHPAWLIVATDCLGGLKEVFDL